MPEGNPLVAQAQSQTTGVTGIGIAESAVDLANGVKDGSWVEGGLGAVGVGLEALSLITDPIGTLAQYGVSWLIEHVQPLKDCLDWLAGNPPVIQGFSDTWANVAKEVNAIAGDMSNEVKNGTAGWSGSGGDAYRGEVAEQTDALAGAASLCDGISTGVMVMGQVVAAVRETVRDLIAELVGKLISWALEEACTLGFATPLVAVQATTAITNTISKVTTLIKKLIKTISNVGPKVKKIVEKLGEIIEKLSKLAKKLGKRAEHTSPSSAARKAEHADVHAPKEHTSPSGAHSPDGSTSPSSAKTHDGSPDTSSPSKTDSTSPSSSSSDGSGAPYAAKTDSSSADASAKDGGSLRDDAANPQDRSQEPVGRCGRREPIDMATGEMYLVQRDVELTGVLPFVLERVHVSSYRSGRLFGPSWSSTVDQRLEIDEQGVCFAGPNGVILTYPMPPSVGGEVFAVAGARWPLSRTENGGYRIAQQQAGRTLYFLPDRAGVAALATIIDRNDNRIDFDYDDAGLIRRMRHSGGYQIEAEVAHGRIAQLSLRNAVGEDIVLARYRYDSAGHLAEVINSSNRALTFDYDRSGRITRWTDRNGEWYSYTYDHTGRCVHTDGSGNALAGTLDYNLTERVSTETNSVGQISRYHFNELNQLIREIDPLGNETRFAWDRFNRLLERTDPLDRSTQYAYDESGNVVMITRPDGSRSLAEYNEFARPIVIVGPDGGTWRREYDERGNLLASTDPVGSITRYTYDAGGRLATVTDALGATQRVETNLAGLSVSVTDAMRATTHYARDQFGRVIAITDPAGRVTRLGWTVEGKPLFRTLPDGATESWRYDGEGNQVEHRDALGRITRTETTHFDMPAAEIRPDGSRLAFNYDSELRLVGVTNQQGLVWRYEYDAAGNLVRETDFDEHEVRYRHDGAGQLVERINGAGQKVSFERDLLGNVVERRTVDGLERFDFDPMGRVIRASNADAELTFQRDQLGVCSTKPSTAGRCPLPTTPWADVFRGAPPRALSANGRTTPTISRLRCAQVAGRSVSATTPPDVRSNGCWTPVRSSLRPGMTTIGWFHRRFPPCSTVPGKRLLRGQGWYNNAGTTIG